jgi:L-lactate dehydrogenase (cytochrome)
VNPFRTLSSVVRFKRLELNGTKRRLAGAASVADLRLLAKRRLPGGVFDYIDGAAEDERTSVRNVSAFAAIEFRPRVLRDVGAPDPATTLFGRELAMPLILAPTGFSRIADPQGELAVARAAERARLPYTLSTMATRSIEDVAGVTGAEARNWFQVYVWRDRGMVQEMLDRAKASGYEAIMITVDTAVLGRRERDVRRGFTLPPKVGLDTLLDGLLHPAWTLDLLRSEPITFANIRGSEGQDGQSAVNLSEYINSQFDPTLSWDDIAWFRERWSGPIILKGIQRVDDALLAADAGVDAVALSNHGGRQLDGAPPPIELVAPVKEAVGDRITIICDGGVRRGSDIAKALALGADACMIGRGYLFGLGAAGEAGVDHALAHYDSGLRRTMALLGAQRISELTNDLVTPAPRPGG